MWLRREKTPALQVNPENNVVVARDTSDTLHTSDKEEDTFIAYLKLIPLLIEAPNHGLHAKVLQPPPVSCNPFEFPASITYNDLIDKIAVALTFQHAVLDRSLITWQPSKPAGSKPQPLCNDTGLKALKKGFKSGNIYVTFHAALPKAGQVSPLFQPQPISFCFVAVSPFCTYPLY